MRKASATVTVVDAVVQRQTKVDPARFDLSARGATMKAVVTTGNGGFDKLEYRDVPVPVPAAGEVLLQVLAAGVNNTEINTRLGWYSSSVTDSTEGFAETQADAAEAKADGGWDQPTPFPFIQGTDCCGRIVEVGPGGDESVLGRRVLVRACMRPLGFGSLENIWMASDFDGAFAQFVKVPASEVFTIESDWSDIQLATIPCSYGTAETMLHRAAVGEGDRVLVTGASGGVGSAAVQLAKRRGAYVVAEDIYHFRHVRDLPEPDASRVRDQWLDQLHAAGADRVVDEGDDIAAVLGHQSVDVVVDNVGGPAFASLIEALARGGRYASSGAIAGPIVSFDKRSFYLKDLTFFGITAWDEPVFPNLLGYIERHEIRPLVARTYPLAQIADAQREFLEKKHLGKFVLVPPLAEPRS
jgi:NADPH:quinone reductase-like Zn-dependent oxidoreductase